MRIHRLTDYATRILALLAESAPPPSGTAPPLPGPHIASAHRLADTLSIPHATVAKILKRLSLAGLLRPMRGKRGGYALARPPEDISLGQILTAIEGRMALTRCLEPHDTQRLPCAYQAHCRLQPAWYSVSQRIEALLETERLSDLLHQQGPACHAHL